MNEDWISSPHLTTPSRKSSALQQMLLSSGPRSAVYKHPGDAGTWARSSTQLLLALCRVRACVNTIPTSPCLDWHIQGWFITEVKKATDVVSIISALGEFELKCWKQFPSLNTPTIFSSPFIFSPQFFCRFPEEQQEAASVQTYFLTKVWFSCLMWQCTLRWISSAAYLI